MRTCERSSPLDPKVNAERGRRCSRYWSRDSSTALGVDHSKAGYAPAFRSHKGVLRFGFISDYRALIL